MSVISAPMASFMSLEKVIVKVLGLPLLHSVAITTHTSPREGVVDDLSEVMAALKFELSSRLAVKSTSASRGSKSKFVAALLISKISILFDGISSGHPAVSYAWTVHIRPIFFRCILSDITTRQGAVFVLGACVVSLQPKTAGQR